MALDPTPLLPGAIALAAALAGAPGAPAAEEPARGAARAGAALGVDLYHIFAAQGGNVFFSPYSISEALALLSTGAEGRTRQEMLRTLHWELPPGRMAAAFGAQDLRLDQDALAGATLSVANGLWYQRGHEPRAAFLETARVAFRADVRVADFSADLPVSQRMINYWAAKKTAGRISDLIPPGTLTPRTELVLVNAIYFKGRWERPFDARRTAPAPFFTTTGQEAATPTMTETARFRTASADGCDLLELPYAGGDLSMVILLPGKRDGLGALEQGLSAAALSQWLDSLDRSAPEELEVALPRFKLTFAAELAQALEQLGMVTAFKGREADFSPINGKRDLFVSAVLHKAYVDVNEVGTEAAAATGVGMKSLAVQRPLKFTVDHPFLFLIRDTATGSLLFLGRVADPRTP